MTEPDPKTVREIAREAVRMLATDSVRGRLVEAAMAKYGIPTGDVNAWHAVYNTAIGAILDAQITVEWPAEQQPADVVTAEQQQDGAVEAVRSFAEVWRASDEWRRALDAGTTDTTFFEVRGVRLTEPQLRAVLAENEWLRAWLDELGYDALSVAWRRRREAEAADASPDGRSGPVERSETSGGIGDGLELQYGHSGAVRALPVRLPEDRRRMQLPLLQRAVPDAAAQRRHDGGRTAWLSPRTTST